MQGGADCPRHNNRVAENSGSVIAVATLNELGTVKTVKRHGIGSGAGHREAVRPRIRLPFSVEGP